MQMCMRTSLRLIDKYREQELLWNVKHPLHYHKKHKNEAWEEISKAIGVGVDDAEKKKASLLGSFRRERGRVRRSTAPDKGDEEEYKSEWFAYKSFGFLMGKDAPRDSLNFEECVNVETILLEEVEDISPVESTYWVPSEPKLRKKKEDHITPIESTYWKPSEPKRQKENDDHEAEEARVGVHQMPSAAEDETSKFLESILQRIRKFNQRTQAIILQKFNTIVFEEEIKLFDSLTSDSPRASATTASHSFPISPSPPSVKIPSSIPPSLPLQSSPMPVSISLSFQGTSSGTGSIPLSFVVQPSPCSGGTSSPGSSSVSVSNPPTLSVKPSAKTPFIAVKPSTKTKSILIKPSAKPPSISVKPSPKAPSITPSSPVKPSPTSASIIPDGELKPSPTPAPISTSLQENESSSESTTLSLSVKPSSESESISASL